MLDLRRLRLLVAAADHGSISAAASALSYSTSSVSEQIVALEREVGSVLLERGARGVALTEPGRVLVGHARRVLEQLAAAEQDVQAVLGLQRGLLRLGFFATAGALLVPRAVAALGASHPGIDVRLVQGDPEHTLALVEARALELALVYRYPFQQLRIQPRIELSHLVDDEILLIMSPDHPLAARKRIRLADLAEHDMIEGVAAGTPGAVIPQACRRAGFEPRIAFSTADHMTVQGLAAAGVGIAFTSQLSFPAVRHDLAVRRLLDSELRREILVAAPQAATPAVPSMRVVLEAAGTEILVEARRRLER